MSSPSQLKLSFPGPLCSKCASLLLQSPNGMGTRQIQIGLLCLLFGRNQNELSPKCSVWTNRPESQGQSNMIQDTVDPPGIRKGSRAGDTAAKCGQSQDKGGSSRSKCLSWNRREGICEDWEVGRTRPRAGAWHGPPLSLVGQSCVHK